MPASIKLGWMDGCRHEEKTVDLEEESSERGNTGEEREAGGASTAVKGRGDGARGRGSAGGDTRDNASAGWDAGDGDAGDSSASRDDGSRGRDDRDGGGHGGNAGAVGDGGGDGLLGNRNDRDLRAGLGLRLDITGLGLGDHGGLRAGGRDDRDVGNGHGARGDGDDDFRGQGGAVGRVAVGDGHVLGRPGGSLGLAVDGAGLGDNTTILTVAVGDVGGARGDGDGLGGVDGLLGLGDGQSGASDNGERSSGETHLD